MNEDEFAENTSPRPFDAKESFRAWEKMRWIFNLAVGLVGVACIALYAKHFGMQDLIELIAYGLVANLFYFLGHWAEMFDQMVLNGKLGLYKFRIHIFIVGTVGSMLLTFLATWAFYNFATAPF